MIKGYTSGVFDLFHVGHLNLLERAREKCDFLVVAVCTDELTKELKGKYPVVPDYQRARLIAALDCVDAVVIKSVDDDVGLASFLRCKTIFKGSDWQNSVKWLKYAKRAARKRIEIVFFERTPRISSSKLRGFLNGL